MGRRRAPKPTKFVRVQIDMTFLMKEPVDSIPFGGDKEELNAVLRTLLDFFARRHPDVIGYTPDGGWHVGLDNRPRISREEAIAQGLIAEKEWEEIDG